jgi:hypothetical protein
MQQPVICAICYNTVDGSDSSKPTQCGHAMHISCFKRLMLHAPCTWTVSDPCTWTVSEACKLVGHIACPMCRRQDEFRVTYPGDVVSTGVIDLVVSATAQGVQLSNANVLTAMRLIVEC